jgi:hypothetical protein
MDVWPRTLLMCDSTRHNEVKVGVRTLENKGATGPYERRETEEIK